MKKQRKDIMICLLIFLVAYNVFSYEYPLKRGSDDWKNLPVEEKNKLLQIPENLLATMPTKELIQAYIDNPFTSLIFAYDNPQDGFNRVYNEFNGLRELMNRPDVADKLLEVYSNMNPGNFDKDWDLVQKGRFTFKFIYLELLIAQKNILQKMTSNESKNILTILLDKLEIKNNFIEEHSILGISHSAHSIANLISVKDENLLRSIPQIDILLSGAIIPNDNVLPMIITAANSYLTE